MKNFSDLFSLKGLRILLIIILITLIFFIIITGGNVIWFKMIFNWFVNYIHSITGLDFKLASAMAALFTGLILMVPLGKLIRIISPIPMKSNVWYKSKSFYRLAIFVGIAILSFVSFVGSNNVYFNPSTGEVEKYYSIRPNGRCYTSSKDGFDPVTGDPLKKMTKDISLKLQNNGLWSKVLVKSEEDNEYFNRKTGEVKMYYSVRPQNKYYVSTEPGFDPLTGEPLRKMTKEIALEIRGLSPPKKEISVSKETIDLNYVVKKNEPKSKIKNLGSSSQSNNTTANKFTEDKTSNKLREFDKSIKPSSHNLATNLENKRMANSENVNDLRAIVTITNNTNQSIIFFNMNDQEMFRVYPRKRGTGKLPPGNYFYVKYGLATKNFFLVEAYNKYQMNF